MAVRGGGEGRGGGGGGGSITDEKALQKYDSKFYIPHVQIERKHKITMR